MVMQELLYIFTYGKGKESKAKQDSCITDKRENPHVVVMGDDVSMNAKVTISLPLPHPSSGVGRAPLYQY
jgi:hypothetical protein